MAQSSIQTAFNYNLARRHRRRRPGGRAGRDEAATHSAAVVTKSRPAVARAELRLRATAAATAAIAAAAGAIACGDCCLGDAWTLKSCTDPLLRRAEPTAAGSSVGYYNDNERLSIAAGDDCWPSTTSRIT